MQAAPSVLTAHADGSSVKAFTITGVVLLTGTSEHCRVQEPAEAGAGRLQRSYHWGVGAAEWARGVAAFGPPPVPQGRGQGHVSAAQPHVSHLSSPHRMHQGQMHLMPHVQHRLQHRLQFNMNSGQDKSSTSCQEDCSIVLTHMLLTAEGIFQCQLLKSVYCTNPDALV